MGGRVADIPTFAPSNRVTRVHAQQWRVIYEDQDTKDLDRAEVKAGLALAEKFRGEHNINMELNGSDLNPEEVEAPNSVVDDAYPDEIALHKAPFEEREFLVLDRAED